MTAQDGRDQRVRVEIPFDHIIVGRLRFQVICFLFFASSIPTLTPDVGSCDLSAPFFFFLVHLSYHHHNCLVLICFFTSYDFIYIYIYFYVCIYIVFQGWHWNSKTWFLTVELKKPPELLRYTSTGGTTPGLPPQGKKKKKKSKGVWTKVQEDFTKVRKLRICFSEASMAEKDKRGRRTKRTKEDYMEEEGIEKRRNRRKQEERKKACCPMIVFPNCLCFFFFQFSSIALELSSSPAGCWVSCLSFSTRASQRGAASISSSCIAWVSAPSSRAWTNSLMPSVATSTP